jgi:hypothetical protein
MPILARFLLRLPRVVAARRHRNVLQLVLGNLEGNLMNGISIKTLELEKMLTIELVTKKNELEFRIEPLIAEHKEIVDILISRDARFTSSLRGLDVLGTESYLEKLVNSMMKT